MMCGCVRTSTTERPCLTAESTLPWKCWLPQGLSSCTTRILTSFSRQSLITTTTSYQLVGYTVHYFDRALSWGGQQRYCDEHVCLSVLSVCVDWVKVYDAPRQKAGHLLPKSSCQPISWLVVTRNYKNCSRVCAYQLVQSSCTHHSTEQLVIFLQTNMISCLFEGTEVSVYVCLSAYISQEPHVQTNFTKFLSAC